MWEGFSLQDLMTGCYPHGYLIEDEDGEDLVKPEIEFMQWTGCKDKNGKDIYEGDILDLDFTWQDVKFGNYMSQEDAMGFYLDGLDGYASLDPSYTRHITVVGHIYQPDKIKEMCERENKWLSGN